MLTGNSIAEGIQPWLMIDGLLPLMSCPVSLGSLAMTRTSKCTRGRTVLNSKMFNWRPDLVEETAQKGRVERYDSKRRLHDFGCTSLP